MKKLFVLMGALLLLPAVMFAADFRTESAGANDNVKNLYIGGQSVVVDANVKSDLIAAGGNVQVNGSVENDLMAAGGTVRVKGNVGKNARIAGGNVFLDGTVGEDVNVFAGSVNLSNSSVVNGDVIVGGGNVDIDGKVNGNVYLYGGIVNIRGTVTGNVTAKRVGTLKVVSGATIGGKLDYSSQSEATIDSGAKVGSVNFTKINATSNFGQKAAKALAGLALVKALIGFLTLLVLVYLFPKSSLALTETAFENVWMNLLIGFVTMIVAPALLLILLFTVIGSGLALLAGLVYLVIFAVSSIYTTLVIGSETWKLFRKENGYLADWKTVLLGAVIVLVLNFIPVIGWLVLALFFLITLGAVLSMGWNRMVLERK